MGVLISFHHTFERIQLSYDGFFVCCHHRTWELMPMPRTVLHWQHNFFLHCTHVLIWGCILMSLCRCCFVVDGKCSEKWCCKVIDHCNDNSHNVIKGLHWHWCIAFVTQRKRRSWLMLSYHHWPCTRTTCIWMWRKCDILRCKLVAW